MASSTITHLWPEEPRREDGRLRLGITIEPPHGQRQTVWFGVPEAYADAVTPRAEPLVVISLFSVMRAGAPTAVVHGEVSPSLLRNVAEFQAAWSSWRPERYRYVEIGVETEREPSASPDANGRTLAAFSGGVDAAFTLFRHRQGLAGPHRARNVTAAMMIQGYDIPADDDAMFAPAFARAEAMTQSLGLPLIPVSTNFREIEPLWEDVHATCVAACLMLFQKEYGSALIGSTEPYTGLVLPWGSNPVTDPLLGHDAFRILHDGAEANRLGKLKTIYEWQYARENLFVCWTPTEGGRNCCRCNKCLRTILNFRVLGLPLPATFRQDADNAAIAGMAHLNDTMVNDLQIILDQAETAGIQDDWVRALAKVVSRYRFRSRFGKTPAVRVLRATLDSNPVGKRVWDVVRRK